MKVEVFNSKIFIGGRYSSDDSSPFRDNWRKCKKVREQEKETGEERLGRKGRTCKNGGMEVGGKGE